MGPRQVGTEIDPGDDVVVIEDGAGAITPGGRRDETIGITAEAVLAVHRVAAVAQLAARLQATDPDHGRFTHQGQAIRARDLVDEVRQGALDLGHFLAPVAFVVGTG
ncbi:hypothetical protein D3C84_712500 [compost metagenome]